MTLGALGCWLMGSWIWIFAKEKVSLFGSGEIKANRLSPIMCKLLAIKLKAYTELEGPKGNTLDINRRRSLCCWSSSIASTEVQRWLWRPISVCKPLKASRTENEGCSMPRNTSVLNFKQTFLSRDTASRKDLNKRLMPSTPSS